MAILSIYIEHCPTDASTRRTTPTEMRAPAVIQRPMCFGRLLHCETERLTRPRCAGSVESLPELTTAALRKK
ncbi:MAG: hypothetical protein WBE97_09110, partial [Candidatus Acidiferrales bacterium]